MANLNGFNANEVEPSKAFEPIPAGKYLAVITGSEMKQTKKQDGEYLELTFEIIEGEFAKRKLWARLNLDNPSDKAREIAQRDLSAICRAVGVLTPKDSQELHDLPLLITVKCRKQDDGEVSNDIKGYEPKSGAKPAPVAVGAGSAANGIAPPWEKR
jgi:hypothetical protein